MKTIHVGFDGDLADGKQKALEVLDADVSEAQQRWLTSLPAQASVYRSKASEAQRYISGSEGDFPWLLAESEVSGLSIADVAQAVVNAARKWDVVGAKIEATRLAAKRNIQAATNIKQVFTILRAARDTLRML